MPHMTLIQGLAGGSFLKGILDQGAADRALRDAQAGQTALTARQIAQYDAMMQNYKEALGKVDFAKALAERKNIAQREYATAMKDIGASSRIAGFRPGDTPIINPMTKATNQYLQNLADTEQNLKLQYAQIPNQLLGQVNASLLNPAIQQAQNQYQFAYQNAAQQNPFAGILGLSPYLFKPQK